MKYQLSEPAKLSFTSSELNLLFITCNYSYCANPAAAARLRQARTAKYAILDQAITVDYNSHDLQQITGRNSSPTIGPHQPSLTSTWKKPNSTLWSVRFVINKIETTANVEYWRKNFVILKKKAIEISFQRDHWQPDRYH
ncbi:unnamed protein product [Dovyalis caffra]|uniref:Uncharacterized protein n=1 Tax=Dovyalis caffra TaxID=77055 RepID=A0AAV1QRF5_9ROSI|nr:unnamed protein product [Dovyalis caffra]